LSCRASHSCAPLSHLIDDPLSVVGGDFFPRPGFPDRAHRVIGLGIRRAHEFLPSWRFRWTWRYWAPRTGKLFGPDPLKQAFISKKVRSAIMASVRTRSTGPELAVRALLHSLGYRYRLNDRSLPGSPDLVFPSRRKAIFVHGCFWHGHRCRFGRLPESRKDYWAPKIAGNRARDRQALRALKKGGWEALVVWQCELRVPAKVLRKMVRFLGRRRKGGLPTC
jgi:DNA mismatch endonuclease (patch repair protein)